MDIPDELVSVHPEFAMRLGLSTEETKRLSLRELSNLAFEKGYDLVVSTGKSVVGQGHLKLTVEREFSATDLCILPHDEPKP